MRAVVFSSLLFLFCFLPVTLAVYYLTPRSYRNVALFVTSLIFYGWGEPVYLALMAVSIVSSYLFGYFIGKRREENPQKAKRLMIASVAVNLSFLFFFKYYNFFARALSLLPFLTVPEMEGLTLPIGISFYTFQIISYTVDVYRGDCQAQKSFLSYGTYVSLFPQLIAGPIVRYRDVDAQLTGRRESVEKFASGVERFTVGLAKKVILGDLLAAGCEYFKGQAEFNPTVLGGWMIVILYTLHLYYDFSGYSDMAIGLGRLFGFEFPENFNYPYTAQSATEFWRRWHMTLSGWFREYVYIPLGGNRRGQLIRFRNLAIVWLLTGFWHGADWNFLLWGVYYAVILIAERLFLLKALEKSPRPVRHLYTLLVVTVGFLIFSYSDLRAGWNCFLSLFGIGTAAFAGETVLYSVLRLLPLFAAACVGATPVVRNGWNALLSRHPKFAVLKPIAVGIALVVCTAYLTDSTFSPFEYTQF